MSRYRNAHTREIGQIAKGLKLFVAMLSVMFRMGRSVNAWREALETNRRIEQGLTSGKLEDARLGTLEDLERLGLLSDHGFFVGFFEGTPVRINIDWHVAIMGPAGFYKSTSLTFPNVPYLLMGGVDGSGRESIVGLDWKNGEMARAIGPGIKEMIGREPDLFRPFDEANTVQINPFQDLIDDAAAGLPIVDEARARLHVFFAESIANAGQNAWIEKYARGLAELVAVARAYLDPEALTLGGMWDFANASFEQVADFMRAAASHYDLAGGYVAAGASAFLNRYDPDDLREFRWIMQSLGEAFALFPPGSKLRTATCATTINIRDYRMSPRALIISIPDKRIMSAAPAVSAILDYVVETAAHAPGPHRLAILAEEFAALPYNENVVKWLRTYRALGIRFVSIVQDRSGFNRFKKDGGHKPFEENSVKITFGISDPDHLQHLERRAGKRAVLIGTHSTSSGVRIPGHTRGGNETLTPVLPASEIARIGTRQALVDIPGQPLFIIDRLPWWELPDIAPFIRDTRFDA